MALTRISTDGIKDGTITGVDLATNVDLVDNQKIRFGTGNDLEIYHNGTASFISNTTGDLKIDSDNIKVRQSNGNAFIKCQSTAVELYYADSKKLETQSGGITVNGNANFGDNKKTVFGDGSDLKIYHDGSHSYLKDSGTGTLRIEASEVGILSADGSETMAQFVENGAASLRYNNSTKFETTASGVDVTGNCTITGNFRGNDGVMLNLGNGDDLQIYHDGTNNIIDDANSAKIKIQRGGSDVWELKSTGLQGIDNQKLMLGTSDDLQIYHDGSNSYILNAVGSGQLTISSDNALNLASRTGTEYFFRAYTNGGAELYYDNSKKFETTNLGAQITGELSLTTHLKLLDDQKVVCGNGEDLLIYHSGHDSFIKDTGTGGIRIDSNQTVLRNAAGDEHIIATTENGAVELFYDGDKKAHTYADGFQTKLLTPMADDTYNMGTSALRWVKLYAASGSIGTSDRNEKNTIVESDLGLSFINKLKPVSYKWNNTNNDTATHYGLIAQDIEEAIKSEGKTLEDFGAIEKPDNAPMGLGYSELISPLIKAVQELSAEVAALKAS